MRGVWFPLAQGAERPHQSSPFCSGVPIGNMQVDERSCDVHDCTGAPFIMPWQLFWGGGNHQSAVRGRPEQKKYGEENMQLLRIVTGNFFLFLGPSFRATVFE